MGLLILKTGNVPLKNRARFPHLIPSRPQRPAALPAPANPFRGIHRAKAQPISPPSS
nr:MAG TPA: hypothetical protein [Caudoviricetes sp.]